MGYIQGLVSVVIPTYKRADKLKRAIDSVTGQTYPELEILVVNDNEADDEYTERLKRLFSDIKDPRVHLIMQEKHINGAAARNAGIKAARGEYIAFLDDDDLWDKRKIERQVDTLSSLDGSYGAVSTLFRSFLDDKIISRSLPYKDGRIWEDILLRNVDVTTCSILIRRTALDETGYFDENLSRHQEVQLLACLAHRYKIYLLREYLLFVDAWGENNPDSRKILKCKKDFLRSVKPLMDELPPRRRRRIITMHQFEVAYVFWKEKNYAKAVGYMRPLFRDPAACYYAVLRVIKRMRGRSHGQCYHTCV